MKHLDLFSGVGGFTLGLHVAWKQWHFVKSKIIPVLCCENNSESKNPSLEMFGTSQLSIFDCLDKSTSLPAGSLVRIFPRLEKVLGSTGHVLGCGGRCGGSLGEYDPLGCLLRTVLIYVLGVATQSSLVWKRSTTPAGRSWWVLGQLEHRMTATEFGSWPTIYGFGNVDHTGKVNGSCELDMAAKNPQITHGKVRLGKLQYPTPTSQLATSGPAEYDPSKPWGQNPAAARNLNAIAQNEQWTTPTASDYGRNVPYQQGGTPLSAQAQQWSTPTGSPSGMYAESPKTTKERADRGSTRTLALDVVDGNWPTPNAMDGERGGESKQTKRNRKAGGLNLLSAIQETAYPAPSARSTNAPRARDWKGSGRDCLPSQLQEEPPSTTGKPRGSLNPAWVSQLMGYPDDWLSKRSEMP